MKLVVAAETHTVTLTLQNGYSEVLYIVRREDGHAFVHGSLVQRRAMMRMTRAYNPTWTPSWQPIKSTRVNIQNLFSGQKNMKNICKICIVDLLLESYCDIFLLLACLVHSIKYMFSIFKQYYIYFHIFFHSHLLHMFSNTCFQFLSARTKYSLIQ